MVATILFIPTQSWHGSIPHSIKVEAISNFLDTKKSPLASETEFLMEQKHWKLLIAISAIESQYCTKQLGLNCWGIGGDSAYRYYPSIKSGIVDANNLIERWQKKGKWLTPEEMNCSYVVPCNENWVITVNEVLKKIDNIEKNLWEIHQSKVER